MPPPPPKAEGGAGVRSDVAPRPSRTTGSVAGEPRLPHVEADDEHSIPEGAFSPDEAIDEQIAELERWALANEGRERSESRRFWILRGTAFLSAVAAAVATPLGFERAGIAWAGTAALFIAIDSAWPGTALRNPYRRAVYDLRALQNTIKLRWDKVRLAYPNPRGARRVANALALLDAIQSKRDDIGRYLGSAESSPGVRRPPER